MHKILQEAENDAKLSKQARIYLELAIIKMCKIEYDTSNEVILSRLNNLEEKLKRGVITAAPAKEVPVSNGKRAEVRKEANLANTPKNPVKQVRNNEVLNEHSKVTLSDVQRSWQDILEKFKARRKMIIYASIVTGKPVQCQNGVLTIEYEEQYKFNKDRLEKPENMTVITEVLSEVFREKIKVVFVVENDSNDEKSTEDIILEN